MIYKYRKVPTLIGLLTLLLAFGGYIWIIIKRAKGLGISFIIFVLLLLGYIIWYIYIAFFSRRSDKIELLDTDIHITRRGKKIIDIPWESIYRIGYYKHGPMTERVYIDFSYATYVIEFDLRDFSGFCRNLLKYLKEVETRCSGKKIKISPKFIEKYSE